MLTRLLVVAAADRAGGAGARPPAEGAPRGPPHLPGDGLHREPVQVGPEREREVLHHGLVAGVVHAQLVGPRGPRGAGAVRDGEVRAGDHEAEGGLGDAQADGQAAPAAADVAGALQGGGKQIIICKNIFLDSEIWKCSNLS